MKKLLAISLFLLTNIFLAAQPKVVDVKRFAFEPDLSYNPDIPSPESHLLYQLGEEFTVYAKVEEYFKTLSASSSRVLFNQYGVGLLVCQ